MPVRSFVCVVCKHTLCVLRTPRVLWVTDMVSVSVCLCVCLWFMCECVQAATGDHH